MIQSVLSNVIGATSSKKTSKDIIIQQDNNIYNNSKLKMKQVTVESLYKNDPKIKPEDVKQLRNWVEKQHHLPKITDLQLLLFLQSCYYSNERAKSAIDNFFTVKTMSPDIFGNRNPLLPANQEAINTALVFHLPGVKDNEGNEIVLGKLIDTNPDRYNYAIQTKLVDMVTMLNLHTEGPHVGVNMILDMQGSVFAHMLKVNPTVAKKFLFYVQEGMPIRLKRLHFINIQSWLDKLMAIVKPFIKDEMMKMISFHSKMETLYESVPQKCLPKDYGGELPSVAELHAIQKQRFADPDNIEFLKWEETQKVDESKRENKAQKLALEKAFGIEGSFKKLDLD